MYVKLLYYNESIILRRWNALASAAQQLLLCARVHNKTPTPRVRVHVEYNVWYLPCIPTLPKEHDTTNNNIVILITRPPLGAIREMIILLAVATGFFFSSYFIIFVFRIGILLLWYYIIRRARPSFFLLLPTTAMRLTAAETPSSYIIIIRVHNIIINNVYENNMDAAPRVSRRRHVIATGYSNRALTVYTAFYICRYNNRVLNNMAPSTRAAILLAGVQYSVATLRVGRARVY